MSHLPPAPWAQPWSSTRAAPFPGVLHAQATNMQNNTYQQPSPIARDSGPQIRSGSLSSCPIHHMPSDWQRSNMNGLQLPPSGSTTFPIAATTTTPATPTYGLDSRGGSEFMHPHAQRSIPSNNLSSVEFLNLMSRTVDNVLTGRLSPFESWLKGWVDHQTHANTSFLTDVNTKLAEEQAAVSKKLDDHAQNYRQKQGELLQIIHSSLSAWKETLMDQAKGAIKAIGEEVVDKVEPRMDVEKLRTYFGGAAQLAIRLEGRAIEQRNAIEMIAKEVQTSNLSMHSRLDALDARMKFIADILSSAASSFASTSPTAAKPTIATSPPTSTPCDATSLTITPPTNTPSPVDVRSSIVTPELLASSFASFQTKLTECMSQAEDMIVRLAEKINAAREEAHAGKEELANMVDVSHDLQTAQMELLRKEISALKAAVGANSSVVPTQAELTQSSEPSALEISEGPSSRRAMSLTERLQTLEANQQKLMRYLKDPSASVLSHDTSSTSREAVDARSIDKDVHALNADTMGADVASSDRMNLDKVSHLAESIYFDEKDHVDQHFQHSEEERSEGRVYPVPETRQEESSLVKAGSVQTQDDGSPSQAPKAVMTLSPARGTDARRAEERHLAPEHSTAYLSSVPVGTDESNPNGLRDGGAHSAMNELPPTSPFSNHAVGEPEGSALTSDSEDDHIPLSKKTGNRRYAGFVCPRPSCGKHFLHHLNFNNHVGRRLCRDLKAAKEKESRSARAPRQLEALQDPVASMHPLESRPAKKRKLMDSSAITTFGVKESPGAQKKIRPQTGDSELSPSNASRSITSYFSPRIEQSSAFRDFTN